ncbi:hypothetical protein GCM10023085_82190 [Actinomadura viridis]|uniref:hypothetical protein n=1 Tax=Actinomadura viridis TaxID=58110 RepID=UPI0031E74843
MRACDDVGVRVEGVPDELRQAGSRTTDKAGQVVFHQTWNGSLGPWTGLAVTALWAAGALLAGAWSVRHRDA